MSHRVFCDNCGVELGDMQNVVGNAIECVRGGVVFRITAGYNTMHVGDVCRKCVFEAIAREAK